VLQEIDFLFFGKVGLICRQHPRQDKACENRTQNPSRTSQLHTSLLGGDFRFELPLLPESLALLPRRVKRKSR
jgi:hypothetical protein